MYKLLLERELTFAIGSLNSHGAVSNDASLLFELRQNSFGVFWCLEKWWLAYRCSFKIYRVRNFLASYCIHAVGNDLSFLFPWDLGFHTTLTLHFPKGSKVLFSSCWSSEVVICTGKLHYPLSVGEVTQASNIQCRGLESFTFQWTVWPLDHPSLAEIARCT